MFSLEKINCLTALLPYFLRSDNEKFAYFDFNPYLCTTLKNNR